MRVCFDHLRDFGGGGGGGGRKLFEKKNTLLQVKIYCRKVVLKNHTFVIQL